MRPAANCAGCKDLAADDLVAAIHTGIQRSAVVLADITEDNLNVWYELGYSRALEKPVVMISCTTERGAGKPYPFDVRSRKIDEYQSGGASDNEKLRAKVTTRLQAILARGEERPSPSGSPRAARAAPNSSSQPVANDVDAMNLIRQNAHATVQPGCERTITFSDWDGPLRLPEGTTGRLLEKALTYPFSVRSKGNTTAVISQAIDAPF